MRQHTYRSAGTCVDGKRHAWKDASTENVQLKEKDATIYGLDTCRTCGLYRKTYVRDTTYHTKQELENDQVGA